MTRNQRLRLARAAKIVVGNAYAPFSKLKVGAAVLDERGRIHTGCNVENSSYGLTTCAERVAIFKAVSEGARHIKAVAVFASTREPTVPCGACLQVVCEFGVDAEVILTNGKQTRYYRLPDLLPHKFRLRPRQKGRPARRVRAAAPSRQ
ncbi:MAG: cytidine deaminase [candidate division WOR-3 bacterium]